MDLNGVSFEIVRYSNIFIDGKPKIQIEMVKVLRHGKYVKFAKLHEVSKYLAARPVIFKPLRN